MTATGATICDQGALVPDLDESGQPTGKIFAEGGIYPPGDFTPTPGPYDAIEVPPGKICVLYGANVTNSVLALAGSLLFISDGSQIGANVQGRGAHVVQVGGETAVVGNVDVRGGGSLLYPFASCSVDNVTIGGNLSCTAQNPASPVINPNTAKPNQAEPSPDLPVTVAGNVLIAGNRIPAGYVLNLYNVTIGGNADVDLNVGGGTKQVFGNKVVNRLACYFNTAFSSVSVPPNTAATKLGQCR